MFFQITGIRTSDCERSEIWIAEKFRRQPGCGKLGPVQPGVGLFNARSGFASTGGKPACIGGNTLYRKSCSLVTMVCARDFSSLGICLVGQTRIPLIGTPLMTSSMGDGSISPSCFDGTGISRGLLPAILTQAKKSQNAFRNHHLIN